MKTDDILEKCQELENFLLHRLVQEHRAAMEAPCHDRSTSLGMCRKCKSPINPERVTLGMDTCLKCQQEMEADDFSGVEKHGISIHYRRVHHLAFSDVELYDDEEPEEIPEI